MSQITSLYVYKVVGQARPGVETRDLVEGLGLDPDGPIDPARMVASQDYYRFFAALAQRDPDGLALPLRIGASMRSDEYGAFGLAWKSAPDLRGSFVRSERYGHVLGSAETYSIEPHDQGCFFSLDKAGNGGLGMRLSNEASMSAVATISDEVATAAFRPVAVYFKHAARGPIEVHENHFRCPVYFETDRDALLVSDEALKTPNRLGDATIAQFFDRHLEAELAAFDDDAKLEKRVRSAVAQSLSEGVPNLSDIASALGLSGRTLQRQLAERGVSYQSLVDMARRELAQQLLRDTNFSLAEVAFLTGFGEQSSFTRAFKRWSGQTPRSYRLGGTGA